MIYKFTKPSHFDVYPVKTIWVYQEDEKESHWIQISEDQESPKWISIGEFFELILREDIKNDGFIDIFYINYMNKINKK